MSKIHFNNKGDLYLNNRNLIRDLECCYPGSRNQEIESLSLSILDQVSIDTRHPLIYLIQPLLDLFNRKRHCHILRLTNRYEYRKTEKGKMCSIDVMNFVFTNHTEQYHFKIIHTGKPFHSKFTVKADVKTKDGRQRLHSIVFNCYTLSDVYRYMKDLDHELRDDKGSGTIFFMKTSDQRFYPYTYLDNEDKVSKMKPYFGTMYFEDDLQGLNVDQGICNFVFREFLYQKVVDTVINEIGCYPDDVIFQGSVKVQIDNESSAEEDRLHWSNSCKISFYSGKIRELSINMVKDGIEIHVMNENKELDVLKEPYHDPNEPFEFMRMFEVEYSNPYVGEVLFLTPASRPDYNHEDDEIGVLFPRKSISQTYFE